MKNYEIMFILRPTLSEDEVKEVVKTFSKVIKDNESKVTEEKSLGQKELAYEINKYKTGYYFYFLVEDKDAKAVKEFDRVALINENIIRHVVVKVEE